MFLTVGVFREFECALKMTSREDRDAFLRVFYVDGKYLDFMGLLMEEPEAMERRLAEEFPNVSSEIIPMALRITLNYYCRRKKPDMISETLKHHRFEWPLSSFPFKPGIDWGFAQRLTFKMLNSRAFEAAKALLKEDAVFEGVVTYELLKSLCGGILEDAVLEEIMKFLFADSRLKTVWKPHKILEKLFRCSADFITTIMNDKRFVVDYELHGKKLLRRAIRDAPPEVIGMIFPRIAYDPIREGPKLIFVAASESSLSILKILLADTRIVLSEEKKRKLLLSCIRSFNPISFQILREDPRFDLAVLRSSDFERLGGLKDNFIQNCMSEEH